MAINIPSSSTHQKPNNNKMAIHTLRFILLILISYNLASCNSQVKSEFKQAAIESKEFGKIVTELDNQIWSILHDSKDNYWFGSKDNGIYKFDKKTITQFTTKDGLVNNSIRGIQEDNVGNIFIKTSDGISKYTGTNFETLIPVKSSKNEWKLQPNDLWFGYINGLYRFDGKTLHELELPEKDLETAFGIYSSRGKFYSPYAVFGVNKDRDGNIWIGTESAGAFRFDGETFLWFAEKELSTLPDGRVPGVRSMIQDMDGNYWLSNFYSKYRIASELPNGYEKMKAVDLPTEIVKDKILYFNSGIADEKGNLWMTTYGGGVWKYDGKTLSNFELKNDEEDVLLIDIYQDNNGTIWLGTDNDGVYKQIGNDFKKFTVQM